MSPKLCFVSVDQMRAIIAEADVGKQSFQDKCVTNQELGHEGKYNLPPHCIAKRSSVTRGMNAYGIAAITAANDCVRNCRTPAMAWKDAVQKQFPESKQRHSREKSCPRGAFLGLCEAGHIRGVPPGDYSVGRKPNLNAGYAVKALELLWDDPSLASDTGELWRRIKSAPKKPNSQMDVVVAHWEERLVHHSRPSFPS